VSGGSAAGWRRCLTAGLVAVIGLLQHDVLAPGVLVHGAVVAPLR